MLDYFRIKMNFKFCSPGQLERLENQKKMDTSSSSNTDKSHYPDQAETQSRGKFTQFNSAAQSRFVGYRNAA